MTKKSLIESKKNMIKTSKEVAKKIMSKANNLTFKELEERDGLLSYAAIQEKTLRQLKNEKPVQEG